MLEKIEDKIRDLTFYINIILKTLEFASADAKAGPE